MRTRFMTTFRRTPHLRLLRSSPATIRRTRGRATVGRLLAAAASRVVYGGGHVGMMGVVAEAALAAGGKVIGVIPEGLQRRELAYDEPHRADRHGHHARAQAAHGRPRRRLHRAARRLRHVRGVLRDRHLGAARPAREAVRRCSTSRATTRRCCATVRLTPLARASSPAVPQLVLTPMTPERQLAARAGTSRPGRNRLTPGRPRLRDDATE